MTFGRYLTVMASSWLLMAVAVAAVNVVVDAIGISPVRVAVAGFNEWKPLRVEYDWIAKRHDVRRQQPRTIFMGSSRIKQSIDPKLVVDTGFAPAYNGGINGSAEYAEVRAYLQDFLRTDSNLQHVFIEVFAPVLLSHRTSPRKRPLIDQAGIAADIADFVSGFFSTGGLSASAHTISANRNQQNVASVRAADDGFAPIVPATHHFSVRNVLNFVLHTGFMQRGGQLLSSEIGAATDMIANCRSRRVECRFFISPLHADTLLAAYHLGLWPELEKLKLALAALAPTYDFTRYNHLIEERGGPVVHWPEAFHFSPALGELVVRAMTGLRTADMPENFGTVLDANKVESGLTAWRQERDNWLARHPELVERMRKAEDDFRNGVSFKAVTDAAMAAGGW
jgi:hypothetical protein